MEQRALASPVVQAHLDQWRSDWQGVAAKRPSAPELTAVFLFALPESFLGSASCIDDHASSTAMGAASIDGMAS